MKPILAAAASAALALAPLAGVAQTEDETTERLNLAQLPTESVQGSNDGEIVPVAQQQSLPVLGTVPTGAIVVGGLIIVAGIVIGIAASDDDDSSTSTTSTN